MFSKLMGAPEEETDDQQDKKAKQSRGVVGGLRRQQS
jgi:hypothetical protein